MCTTDLKVRILEPSLATYVFENITLNKISQIAYLEGDTEGRFHF